MKAIVSGVEVEGTAEEILALIRAVQGGGSVPATGLTTQDAAHAHDDFIFRVLKRRPLSSEQNQLLSILRTNDPGWTTAKDLQKALKFSASQLGGILGAFGKRLSATEGYMLGQSLFAQEWDYDVDCYRYRLADGVIAAVRRAGI